MADTPQTDRDKAGVGELTKTRWRRVIDMVHRGFGHAGPDRDALLAILKSVLAATVAWLIANNLLGAPSATFAPFTALLMVQATISQSLDQSARYAAAMVAGVVLAGLLTPLLGAATWTFAGLILIALVFGRWRTLGRQGPQVGVAALFDGRQARRIPAQAAFRDNIGTSRSQPRWSVGRAVRHAEARCQLVAQRLPH